MTHHIVKGAGPAFRRLRNFYAAGLAAALAVVIGTQAHAQAGYPAKPVHLIIPYGAGGIADVGMRILTEKLSTKFGKPFVVENRPGAGGIVAAKAGAAAAADGYTLSMTGNNYAIAAALFKSLPYNILKDFDSVSTVAFFDVLIVTREGSPLKSVGDIVKAAKANPGKLNIGTINPGSTQNLAAELFKSTAGIKATIVPFRTSPDMATAVLRGDIDIAFEFFAAAQGLIRDKKIVVLASTGPVRTPYLPQVPTVIESGVPGFDVSSWNAISVPTGTPAPVIQTLNKAINEALVMPDVQEKAKRLGMQMRGSPPAEVTQRHKNDIAKWAAVIEKAGIPKRD